MRGAVRDTLIRAKLVQMEESVLLVKKHLPESFEEFFDMGLMKDGIYKRIEACIRNRGMHELTGTVWHRVSRKVFDRIQDS